MKRARIHEVYKCNVCGNVAKVLHGGKGQLVCCGQPIELLKEKTSAHKGLEKHVPVSEEDGRLLTVNVGEISHPMSEGHYIKWIEIQEDSGKKQV